MPENIVDRDDVSTHHAGLVSLLLDLGVRMVIVDDDQSHAHVFYHDDKTPPLTIII